MTRWDRNGNLVDPYVEKEPPVKSLAGELRYESAPLVSRKFLKFVDFLLLKYVLLTCVSFYFC